MSVKLAGKNETNMYKAMCALLSMNYIEFSKISKQKFIPLEKDAKNIAFDKLNTISNLVDMLCYEDIDYYFSEQLKNEISNKFTAITNEIFNITKEDTKIEDMLHNITMITQAHNLSSKDKMKTKENLKPLFIETKNIYTKYVLNGKQNSFRDNFYSITPRKINFKQWNKSETKPDLIFSSDISTEKFITEIYTNNKDYISIEANEKGIVLLLKNMEDKTKDIKKTISFQDLRKLIEGDEVEAVIEAPVKPTIKETKVATPTLSTPIKPAPVSVVEVVEEAQDEAVEEQTNQPEDETMKEKKDVSTMTAEEKEKICDKETLKTIVQTLKDKDCI